MFLWSDYVTDHRSAIEDFLQDHPSTALILARLADRIRRVWQQADLCPTLDVENDREDGTLAMIVSVPSSGDPIVDSHRVFAIRRERAQEELALMRTESVIIRIVGSSRCVRSDAKF